MKVWAGAVEDLREENKKSCNPAFISRFPFCPLMSSLGYGFPCVLSAYGTLKHIKRTAAFQLHFL